MNISFCKKIFLFAVLCTSYPIIHAQPAKDAASERAEQDVAPAAHDVQPDRRGTDQLNAEQAKALESFFEQTSDQLTTYIEHLENIVQQMALIASSHQLRGVNAQTALEHLAAIKHDLEIAKQQLDVRPVNPQSVLLLISYAQVMTKYIHDVVKSGLTQFPDIKHYISMMQKRSASIAQKTPQDIEQTMLKMQQAALKLEKAAESVGISPLNKAVRFTQKKWTDWDVNKKLKWIFIGSLVLYMFLPHHEDYDARIDTGVPTGSKGESWVRTSDIYTKREYKIPFLKNINLSENYRSLRSFFGATTSTATSPDNDIIIPFERYTGRYILESIKAFLGGRPHFDRMRNITIPAQNSGKLRLYSGVEYLMLKTGIGSLAFSSPLFDLTVLGALIKDDLVTWWKKGEDQLSRISSRLRGDPMMVSELRYLKEPRHTLDAVIGREDAKQIATHIVDYIINPARFDRTGTAPEQGYLLAGPTRSGKTFFAEAIAGTIRQRLGQKEAHRFNFISLSASEVMQQKGGVATVLAYARNNAPCILFIDEIDMLGLQRERNAEMLSSFLTELSGAMSSDNDRKVILIGATNLPENLDRALLQHGRIGTTLWFYYPTHEERLVFMKRKLSKWITSIDENYLARLARETHGYNFADLEAILDKAKLYADQHKKSIDTVELERAFDRVIRNIIDEPLPVAQADKHLYAVHNGAKALVTALLGTNEQLSKVTIKRVESKVTEKPLWARYDEHTASAIEKRKETFGKVFTHTASTQRLEKNRVDYIAEIKILLAGHAAEKMLLGSKSVDYNPYDEAIALAMCRFLIFKGALEDRLPKTKRQELETKSFALVKQCKEEVKKLLLEHKDALVKITDALMTRETLEAREVHALAGIPESIAPSDAQEDDEDLIDNDSDDEQLETTPAAV